MMDENKCLVSAVDFYFIEEDGGRFKSTLPYPPYFYLLTRRDTERDVSSFLTRKLSGRLAGIDLVDKEDMDMVLTPSSLLTPPSLSGSPGKPSGGAEEKVSEAEVPVSRGPDEGKKRHHACCEEEQGEGEISVGL